MKKICIVCKEEMYGREDKRFCSSACKNKYHKMMRQQNTAHIVLKIDSILHRNRTILQELFTNTKSQKLILPRIILKKKGFDFEHFTGTYTNSKNKLYHYIYDFAWMEFSNQEVMLVRK